MESIKRPGKNTRKKLEVLVETAVALQDMVTRKRAREPQEIVANESTDSSKKTKYACIVEAHESTRRRLESTLPRTMRITSLQKGLIQ